GLTFVEKIRGPPASIRSILGENRGGLRPVEVIVHASPHDVDLRVEVIAPVPAEAAGRSATAEIGIEIFELRRPPGREHPLNAAAGGPAGAAVFGAPGLDAAIGEARRAVDEQRGREQPAGATANRADPVEAETTAVDRRDRHQSVAGNHRRRVEGEGSGSVAADARALEVGLGADDDRRIELEVVADLSAADDASGAAGLIAVGQEEQVRHAKHAGADAKI